MKNKKCNLTLLTLAILSIGCTNGQQHIDDYLSGWSGNATKNTLSDSEKVSDWHLLFNGTNMDGWRGYNENNVPDCWEVEDGVLKVTTEGGKETANGIITNKQYKNFVFTAEFKLTKGANSGIIFQVKEDKKYKYPYETGPEYQVIDHQNWHNPLEDWQICGANYAMYAPEVKEYKAVDEWNQVVIIVDNNKVIQMLNGNVVVEYEKYTDEWKKLRNSGKWKDFPDYGKYDIGHIALQNHGTNVFYRNIKIKKL